MPANITKFKAAMEKAYGALDDNNTSHWEPPSLSLTTSRHLYTDAVAVLNFITLSKLSSITSPPTPVSEVATQRAKLLIQKVHDTLGRTADRSRRLKGASDEAPLNGGLRSGSLLSDSDTSAPDGQSHRDLMLWIFALNRYSVYTNDKTYNNLAIQLAEAIIPYFVKKSDDGSVKILAKLSADLAEGPLDEATQDPLAPYDAYTVLTLLQRTDGAGDASSVLSDELRAYESLLSTISAQSPQAPDKAAPLEIGHSLWITHFLKDSNDSIRSLCQGSFSALMILQRTRYFSIEKLEDRKSYADLTVASAIRCFDYSKSSAVFEGIADNITLAWNGIINGQEGESENDNTALNGERIRDLVLYAAALEPGAFKDGFLDS